MSRGKSILALDQGTTSTRAIVFDERGRQQSIAQEPIAVTYPRPGWVNQDATELWESTRSVLLAAVEQAGLTLSDIAAIGITNQRETTVLWERASGSPVCPAIVWQSRQSADVIDRWDKAGLNDLVREKTGLVLDPYFSASKIRWLFDQNLIWKRLPGEETCFLARSIPG